MTEQPLSIKDAEQALEYRAASAEVAKWGYEHLRNPSDGERDGSPSTMVLLAERGELRLDETHGLLTAYGVLDADRADRIVAEARAHARAELDAKWLEVKTDA